MLPFCLCTHRCGSERSVPLLPLNALLRSFVARSALVPLQSVAFPETVLSVDSKLLWHYKQIVIQPVHVSSPVLFWARAQSVHLQLVRHSRSQLDCIFLQVPGIQVASDWASQVDSCVSDPVTLSFLLPKMPRQLPAVFPCLMPNPPRGSGSEVSSCSGPLWSFVVQSSTCSVHPGAPEEKRRVRVLAMHVCNIVHVTFGGSSVRF